MIQRIQSSYSLIVTGLLVTTICLPMGYLIDTIGEHPFKALGINVNRIFQSTWGVFGILTLSILVAFVTVFSYKNRTLQIRMSIFSSLLLVGYYIIFIALYFVLKSDANLLRTNRALRLPLVSVALNVPAIRTIRCDEVMVKAADRLR